MNFRHEQYINSLTGANMTAVARPMDLHCEQPNLDDVFIVDPEVIFVADLLVFVVNRDDDLLPGDQFDLGVDPGLHNARPDLGSLRVQSDADRQPDVGGRLADVVDRLEVIFVRAVREVHPRDVQTCVKGHARDGVQYSLGDPRTDLPYVCYNYNIGYKAW